MADENKPAELRILELNTQNGALIKRVKALQMRVDELEKALEQANDVIEGDVKARLAAKIMANSRYTIENLSKMSADELNTIDQVLSMSNAPYKGIRSAGTDKTDYPNLTVPNLFGKTDGEIQKMMRGE